MRSTGWVESEVRAESAYRGVVLPFIIQRVAEDSVSFVVCFNRQRIACKTLNNPWIQVAGMPLELCLRQPWLGNTCREASLSSGIRTGIITTATNNGSKIQPKKNSSVPQNPMHYWPSLYIVYDIRCRVMHKGVRVSPNKCHILGTLIWRPEVSYFT
jgi:hypothetical protein